jgi:hypothetical protein
MYFRKIYINDELIFILVGASIGIVAQLVCKKHIQEHPEKFIEIEEKSSEKVKPNILRKFGFRGGEIVTNMLLMELGKEILKAIANDGSIIGSVLGGVTYFATQRKEKIVETLYKSQVQNLPVKTVNPLSKELIISLVQEAY